MEYQIEEVSAPGREKVEMLGATYEKGKPDGQELGHFLSLGGGGGRSLDAAELPVSHLSLDELHYTRATGYLFVWHVSPVRCERINVGIR